MAPRTPTLGETPDGKPVRIDIDRLIVSRCLIQANSGAGKSWTIRRLLEETHGKVQHLVLDIEGEFHTLRERFDYVLAARTGGDTLADVRSAPLLARRLLELGVSAVVDLYELKAGDRVRFVRAFLEALIDAPRALWHPALVIVDEAHHFCPQAGQAESAGAVIDLMTRGRKRGFCGVLATQRLSKLHKDAAAEANVKLIGRASLDVDLRRAADELGFSSRDDLARIRALPAGRFFAFGPGVSDQVVEVQIGPVATTHPRAGRGEAPVPPAREQVRKVLDQLKDLPKQAGEEVRDLAAAKVTIAELRRELRGLPTAPAPKVERVEVPVLKEKDLKRIETVAERAVAVANLLMTSARELMLAAEAVGAPAPAKLSRLEVPPKPSLLKSLDRPVLASRAAVAGRSAEGTSLPKCERAILAVLAQHGASPLGRVALLAGYRQGGGGFRNALSRLRTSGLIDGGNGADLQLTDAGIEATSSVGPLPTGSALIELWRQQFGLCERQVIDALLAAPAGLSVGDLAEASGYQPGGGGFRNALSRLRTAGLLVGGNGQVMRLCDDLVAGRSA